MSAITPLTINVRLYFWLSPRWLDQGLYFVLELRLTLKLRHIMKNVGRDNIHTRERLL